MTAKKLYLEYKSLFFPGDELADISNNYSGHGLSAKFSTTSGNSTAKNYKFDCKFVLKYYSNCAILFILNSF